MVNGIIHVFAYSKKTKKKNVLDTDADTRKGYATFGKRKLSTRPSSVSVQNIPTKNRTARMLILYSQLSKLILSLPENI